MKNNNTKVGTVALLVFVLLMLKQRRDQQRQSRYQWFVGAHNIAAEELLSQINQNGHTPLTLDAVKARTHEIMARNEHRHRLRQLRLKRFSPPESL